MLAPGEIPTADFYVTPRLRGIPAESVFRFDSRRFDSMPELPPGAFVVIVRHAVGAWLAYLAQHRERLSGVAFLMDDDIPGAWRSGDVPLDYGLWTSGRYWLARAALARVCDRIWVSTAALQRRYATAATRVVGPLEFSPRRQAAPAGTRRWGYHGTRIHRRELRWLVPVVADVQQAVPQAEFEVFGDRATERLFAGIPRVTVLPPRPWPDYLAHCHNSHLAVGLAPMLPGRFNAVRSHTKVFDIARCGAVGVFSAREPYAPLLADAGAALLPDETAIWAAELVRLLQDDALRLARYRRMVEWLEGTAGGEDMAALIEEGKRVD